MAHLLLLARVHARLVGSRERAVWAFAAWSLPLVCLVVALAATRSSWAPLLSDASTKFYPLATSPHTPGWILRHQQAWAQAWSYGLPILAECGLMLVLGAVQAAAGYHLGNRPWLAVAVGCVGVGLTLAGYLAWCPWFLPDYDLFHGDIIAGAMLIDTVMVVANDPHTTLAVLSDAVITLGSVAILSRAPAAAVVLEPT